MARFVLDTNVILYFLGDRFVDPFPAGAYAISVISELELLAYPGWFLQRSSASELFWRIFPSLT